MNKKLFLSIFFLISIMLFFTPTTLSLETLQTSTSAVPVIQLFYQENDAPVTILTSSLTSLSSNKTTPLTCQPKNILNYSFICTSTSYLLDGEYELFIRSQDADENIKELTRTLIIDAVSMDMWVSDPAIPIFEDKKQNIAIKNTTLFNITFKTQHPSNCKIFKGTPQIGDQGLPFFYEAQQTNLERIGDGRTHRILAHTSASNSSAIQITSFYYQNYEETNAYSLICQQETAEENVYDYHIRPFYLGHDTTSFSFTEIFEPPTIFDFYSPSTKLSISGQNNKILVCEYLFIENPHPAYPSSSGSLLNEEVSSIQNLSSTLTKTFSFKDVKPTHQIKKYNYSMKLSCYDLAGNTREKNTTFHVDISTALSVALQNNYFSQNQPTLNFTSNLLANCSYFFQYKEKVYSDLISEEVSKQHELKIPTSLEDGEYTIEISCVASTAFSSKEHSFTIDTVPPQTPIIQQQPNYCGKPIKIHIEKPINDTVRYIISMNEQENTTLLLENYTTVFTSEKLIFTTPASISTQDEKTYVYSIYAMDEGGLTSQTVTTTITQKNMSFLQCDVIPPTISYEKEELATGYTLTLTCIDEQSGCKPNYAYNIIEINEDCDALTQSSTFGHSVSVAPNKKFCYSGANNADLTTNGSVILGEVDPDLLVPEPEPEHEPEPEPEPECGVDEDCDEGYFCTFSGLCQKKHQPLESEQKGFFWLGLIFIILGLLSIGGGVAYIYHSRTEKERLAKARTFQQQNTTQNTSLKNEQEKKQQHYQELVEKKRQEQTQQKNQRVQEREDKRKSVLGSFTSDKQKNSSKEYDNDSQEKNIDQNTQDKNYVDISQLDKKTSPNKHFSGQIPNTKKTIEPQHTSSTFLALEELVKKDKEDEQMLDPKSTKTFTPELFLKLFAKQSPEFKSDTRAILSMLKTLLAQGKMNTKDIHNSLEKLAQRNYIEKKDIEKHYKSIIGPKL